MVARRLSARDVVADPVEEDAGFALRLLCLRLAVIVCHARDDVDPDAIALRSEGGAPTIALSAAWADQRPRALHLLRGEVEAWSKTGLGVAPRLLVGG